MRTAWNKGMKMSIEQRKVYSLAMKARWARGDYKNNPPAKGQIAWNKGIETPPEVRIKQSLAKKGKVSPKKGRPMSQERYKTHLSAMEKTRGRKLSPLQRAQFAKVMKEKIGGNKNWKWIEDRSKLAKRQERNDTAYREWRRIVWQRDNWKCKIDDKECKGKIEAHHILSWAEYPELRYNINNGITLCHAHHPRKREEEKRLSPFFQTLINLKH